jgi:hypothetical protein
MSTPDPLAPTLAQVGAILRARTKDSEGVEHGTFTANTRPTDSEAQQLIDVAVGLVHVAVGQVPDASPCASGAWVVAALGAACLIEKSYWPEQIATARSAYEQYWTEYQSALSGLARCLGVTTNGEGGAVSYEWGQVPVTVAGLDLCGDRAHGCGEPLPEYATLNQALGARR